MSIRLTIIDPASRDALKDLGLRTYEDFVSCQAGEVVGRTSTTETRRVPAGGGDSFHLKIYRYAGRQWRHRFRRDKGFIEARNYQVLANRCSVRVPEVLAHGSRRSGFRLMDAFIVTRTIPLATPLDEWVDGVWPDPCAARDNRTRRNLIAESAAVASRMHASGFFHIDLQWRNMLVTEDAGGGPCLWVIDSARGGLRRNGVYQAHGRLRDLSSLSKSARTRMTRREQVSWLRLYFGVRRLSRAHHDIVRTIQQDRAIKDHHASA
jgi:tRNA A-37 threonylcarbamoyl transferase component Bud32